MRKVDVEPNSPEWLEMRKTKIGASDIPKILGMSPYNTPFQLWQEKVGFKESKQHAGMHKGHAIEEKLREYMPDGNVMSFEPLVALHDHYDWAMASIDSYNGSEIREIKYMADDLFNEMKQNGIPHHFQAQMQWQMWVTDMPTNTLIAQSSSGNLYMTTLDFNPSFIEDNFAEILSFKNCIDTMTPPANTDKDYVYIDDEAFREAEEAYSYWKKIEDDAKKNLKDYREKLIEMTDDGNCEGDYVKMCRVNTKGNVDWQKLATEKGISKEEIEKYRKPQIGYYRIDLKESSD